MLSNGEFVVNAAAARQNAALLQQINSSGARFAGRVYAPQQRAVAAPTGSSVTFQIDSITTVDPDAAINRMHTKAKDALAVAGINRIAAGV
jgi:hypothetical protein